MASTTQGVLKSKQEGKRSLFQIHKAAGPVWNGEEYPRVEPGRYLVRVNVVQGPEWVRRYSRWSVRLGCCLVHEPGEVSGFFNLGNDSKAQRVGRASRYWRAWTLANEAPPRKGQLMDPGLFLDKFFWVEVEDSLKDSDGERKSEGEVYSRITKVLSHMAP